MKNTAIVLAAIILILPSCSSYSKAFSEDLDKLVPADFGAQTTTILVEKSTDRVDNIFRKSFDKNYSGEYLVVSTEDINTTYSDTDKFKYVLGVGDRMTGALTSESYRKVFTVSLLDRKTGKNYEERDLAGSLLEKHIKAYLAKLEQARKK